MLLLGAQHLQAELVLDMGLFLAESLQVKKQKTSSLDWPGTGAQTSTLAVDLSTAEERKAYDKSDTSTHQTQNTIVL